jgi:hypothetical protein
MNLLRHQLECGEFDGMRADAHSAQCVLACFAASSTISTHDRPRDALGNAESRRRAAGFVAVHSRKETP